jgi:5'(3')-deoxyribonucleotidase
VKPSCLLDIDGVVADFVSAALALVQQVEFYDRDEPDGLRFGRAFDPSIIHTWELFDSLPEPERSARDEVYRRMKAPGGCRSIPVYPGSRNGVERLREICDITIVTSPFEGSPTWMHERERWLEEHFDIDRKHIIHATEKHRVHGDVFIDDKLSHLQAWLAYWRDKDPLAKAILWDTPRSRGQTWSERITRWDTPRSRGQTWSERITRVSNWDELIVFLKREFAT